MAYLSVLLQEHMVDSMLLGARLETLPLPPEHLRILRERLGRLVAAGA